jgi:sterol desaturase/sphingolipid hydroxylase (fatty acid hydroxylase superfamily)
MTAKGWIILFGVISLVVAIELIIGRKKKVQLYTLTDTLVNISCGILERVFDFFWFVMMYFIFVFLFENAALWQIPQNPFTWFLALLAADFLAYWHHRLSHEINILWAAHIVHHQSEQLNLSTVFRVSLFAVINRSFFFVWMPLLGFDPVTTVSAIAFVGAFQFVTHSRLVPKLGFLEHIFSTPSNHRVHHARNEKYIDHNYGHVFIIWDKMFKTYTPEEEEPDYGITTGFESTDAYNAQFFYWKDLFARAKKTTKWKDKFKLFISMPSWTPEEVGFSENSFLKDDNGNRLPERRELKPEFGVYMLINNLFTLAIFIWLIALGGAIEDKTMMNFLRHPQLTGLAGILFFSVFAHGRMLDNKPLASYIDVARLIVVTAVVTLLFGEMDYASWLIPALWSFASIMILWLMRLNAQKVIGSFRTRESQTV